MTGRSEQLAAAWDEAVAGYEEYFVPRFEPWLIETVEAVTGSVGALPPGPVLVPCCGTFPELPALRKALPDRELVGVDLSAGMIELAWVRAAGDPQVRLVVGDAAEIAPEWVGACAAVVSAFGLQQVPDPPRALAAWVSALRAGGVLSVMFWSPENRETGPFALMAELAGRTGEPPAWPRHLAGAVADAGGVVDRDAEIVYPMRHPSAAEFFTAMTTGGPGRVFARTKTADELQALRERFLDQAPEGPWVHEPVARHVVARRPLGAGATTPPPRGTSLSPG